MGEGARTIPPVVKGLENAWHGADYVVPCGGMSDSLKSSEPNKCKVKQIEFFHNSEPMVAQLVQLAKLAQLVQLAQLAQFDQFFKPTDRNFAAKSITLVCSNFIIFRNKTTWRFEK